MKRTRYLLSRGVLALLAAQLTGAARASSHMDAPLITRDPSANTTDVYAFVNTNGGKKCLTVALGVYPFEEPGIGPNLYNFDDNVLYQVHLALGKDYKTGKVDLSYQFRFTTHYKDKATILPSFLGVIENVGDAGQNLTQTYTVTKVDHRVSRGGGVTLLGAGVVPPNNQGIATPQYNQDDNGENPAKDGVATAAELDQYTTEAITNLSRGYRAFAGQRDDGFYGDIQAVFDLLQLRNPGVDAQAGFNIHELVLEIPVSELGGDQQIVGVYATTSRQQISILRPIDGLPDNIPQPSESWVQVARQGNPLFNEGLVAVADKDLYSSTSPTEDETLFKKYALTPELAHLLNVIVFGSTVAPESNRTDIAGIFIPDLIKVDMSTGPCRLGGNGTQAGADPDDPGFSPLGIFGGDVLTSTVQPGFGGGTVPGGWPNGRRFGDDVVTIAVTALISDLRVSPPIINGPAGDNVNWNDVAYNKVFPYESTPHNGRNHLHSQ
jgi:hypothetical protein